MGLFSSISNVAQTVADSPIWYANPWTAAAKGVYEGGKYAYAKTQGNTYRQNYGAFGTSDGKFNFGMIPFIGAGWTNERNLKFQQENLDYQKWLQQEMFRREDSAVQRRAADLKAAGLSQTLAAGQGAGAGAVISTKAKEAIDTSGAVLQLIKMVSDITTSFTQRQLMESQTYSNNARANTENWNLRYYKDQGLPTNASGLGKVLAQIFGVVDKNQEKGVIPGNDYFVNKLKDLEWILKPQGEKNKELRRLEQEEIEKRKKLRR